VIYRDICKIYTMFLHAFLEHLAFKTSEIVEDENLQSTDAQELCFLKPVYSVTYLKCVIFF